MEERILISTKKGLGLPEGDEAFDLDVITFINSAFSTLDQVGVGPTGGFYITGPDELWPDLNVPDNQLNVVRTYLFLKVKLLFDPPNTSYVLKAFETQLEEYLWRLATFVETESA